MLEPTRPIKPIEETEEYAAAVEDEAPLRALMTPSAERVGAVATAVRAARAYTAAVQATELFIVDVTEPLTEADHARYAMLAQREDIARQRRREAFAALGLHHEPITEDGTW